MEWWQQAGVFDQLQPVLLLELNAAGKLNGSRACVDGSHMRKRVCRHRSSPVDRRKTCSKHHLNCHGRGSPLKVITTAANVNIVIQPLALVDASGSPSSRCEMRGAS
jgi:hypothetical protein